MNKKQLVQSVSRAVGVPAVTTNKILSVAIQTIYQALVQGDRVTLVGFGSFEVRQREGRLGRNPQNGDRIQIPSARVAHFKPGKPLKKSLL